MQSCPWQVERLFLKDSTKKSFTISYVVNQQLTIFFQSPLSVIYGGLLVDGVGDNL